jgi:hypothetical protein
MPRQIRHQKGLGSGTEVEFIEKFGEVAKAPDHKSVSGSSDDFAAYVERVRGILDLGMTTDEFTELLRGE